MNDGDLVYKKDIEKIDTRSKEGRCAELFPNLTAKTEKLPMTGRQKKQRYHIFARVILVTGPHSTEFEGKPYYSVTLQKSDKRQAVFTTFSATQIATLKAESGKEYLSVKYTVGKKNGFEIDALQTISEAFDEGIFGEMEEKQQPHTLKNES